jgi:hypothetical protein
LVGKPNKTRIRAFAELRGFIVDELRLSREDARIIIDMWSSEIQEEEAEENAYEEIGRGMMEAVSASVAPAPAPEPEDDGGIGCPAWTEANYEPEPLTCEVCELCDPEVRLYEKSNQYWCESCAEQVPCKECGCWYFKIPFQDVCSGCMVAPAPAPVSFVSVPSTYEGECGVRDGRLYIPFCRMGAIGKDALLLVPSHMFLHYSPIPEKMDMAWFADIARHLNRCPQADYDSFTFQKNIIRPNIAKIVQDLGVPISDRVKSRIENDLWCFLNHWTPDKRTLEEMKENNYLLPCCVSLLLDADVEY